MTQGTWIPIALALAGVLVTGPGVASAAPVIRESVPAPRGLIPCPPQSPLRNQLSRITSITSPSVELSGCFASAEQVALRGMTKRVNYPLEFGYAINYQADPSKPFTTRNIDELFSTVYAQWKNVVPLWKDTGAEYNKRVEKIISNGPASIATKSTMKVERPVLVSMTRIDANSYEVVSIRERKISSGGATFDLVSAEGSALLLRHGNLVRLSLSRDLRSPADITSVKVALDDWATRLRTKSS